MPWQRKLVAAVCVEPCPAAKSRHPEPRLAGVAVLEVGGHADDRPARRCGRSGRPAKRDVKEAEHEEGGEHREELARRRLDVAAEGAAK